MSRILLIITLLLAVNTPSYSAEKDIWKSFNWTETGDLETLVTYENTNIYNSKQFFLAEIDFGKDGVKRVYFTHFYRANLSSCEQKRHATNTVIKVNNQAIKAIYYCNPFNDNKEKHYLSLTAKTDAGQNFIVNAFKQAKSHIIFEFGNMKIFFPATGFSKSWNSSGGNAI